MGFYLKKFKHPDSKKEPSELLPDESFILLNTILAKNEIISEHEAPSFSFFTTLTGSIEIAINSRVFKIDADTFLLANTGSTIELLNGSVSSELFIFFFSEEIVKDLYFQESKIYVDTKSLNLDIEFYEFPSKIGKKLKEELIKIISTIKKDTIAYFSDEFLYLILKEIINYNVFTFSSIDKIPTIKKATQKELYYRAKKAKQFIDENYCEKISVKQIAEEVNLNPYQLIRTYKSIYAITPIQYQIQCRINKARYLLQNTKKQVSDICYDLGFESLSSFSLLFKERAGTSPKKYRDKKN